MGFDISHLLISSEPGFSFEVLPPLKGKGIKGLFDNVDRLMPFAPRYINITTHRSELVYKSVAEGLYQRVSERSRPGTVAVAAAIQHKYNIPAVPHLICSGFTAIETEYALIDLCFLGITNLLVLRGDKAKHEPRFATQVGGYAHASELEEQINRFNKCTLIDGTQFEHDAALDFSYGVAGYPERHEESPNAESDLLRLKEKVDLGASYVVTQMFFDNDKFYSFVDACRAIGIKVPIVPALKPIVSASQLSVLPKTFRVELPKELVCLVEGCSSDADIKKAGVEWAIRQTQDLISHGYNHVHYYSHNAVRSVEAIVRDVFTQRM